MGVGWCSLWGLEVDGGCLGSWENGGRGVAAISWGEVRSNL